MKRQVLVSISGRQLDLGADPVELLLPGTYYKRKGTHYIKYAQYDENTGAMVQNLIKIQGHCVEMRKTGENRVQMHFEKDSNYTSYYDMGEYSVLVGTRTGDVQITEAAGQMDVALEYDLYLNEQYISNCRIAIRVVERSGV